MRTAPEQMLQIIRRSRLLLAATLHGPEDWQGLGELLQATGLSAAEIMLRKKDPALRAMAEKLTR